MVYCIDKESILKANPAVNAKLVEEALAIVKKIEEMGVLSVGNRYIPPHCHTIYDRANNEGKNT